MKELRILCFGDSLTEGFTRGGTLFHPYAKSMLATLKQGLPNVQFHVDIDGRSGDRICSPGLFMPRIQAKFESNVYDWVILLGGTNDLGWGGEPSEVFSGLEDVENVALKQDAKILVMTVPEVSMANKDLDTRRDALNSSIRAQCDDSKIFLFDLSQKMPYRSLPPAERRRIWDDGVHLTALGYDKMGSYLAVRLMEIISASRETKIDSEKLDNPTDAKPRERIGAGKRDDWTNMEDFEKRKWTCGACVIQ